MAGADWSRRGDYIAKHGITAVQADEALADPARVVFEPDYNSTSGTGIRTVGYSSSAGAVLTVITYYEEGVQWGASAWKSNNRDRRYYRGEP